VKPRRLREAAHWVHDSFRVSERRAAGLMKVPRGTLRYRPCRDPLVALRSRLKELAATRVRYGYRRLTVLLKREGWKVNAKRVYRIYSEEGLTVRTKQRKKLASRARVPLSVAVRPNQRWSMDFIQERTEDGRNFRVLSVIDQFTRECIALEAERSMTGNKVVAALERVMEQGRPAPESITTDNGSEFAGKALDAWALRHGVKLSFIRPGKPVENGFVESFHGRLRDECLKVELFFTLADAQQKLATWRDDYNHQRPHSALADRTPAAFAALHHKPGDRRFALSTVLTANGHPSQGFASPANAALDSGVRPLLKSLIRGRSTSVNRPNIYSSFLEFPDTIERPSFGPPEQP